MNENSGHHLILGELTDYITGKIIPDTHDERYRQKIARILVEEKKFSREEILPDVLVTAFAGQKRAVIRIDFLIVIEGRPAMLIRYGPGSLVTRRRAAIAASRVVRQCQIPVVAVTNGETAEILSGTTGTLLGEGFQALPSRPELKALIDGVPETPVLLEKKERESRILYAFDVDDACPCDDTTCISKFEIEPETGA
jgi:hypothetical protein